MDKFKKQRIYTAKGRKQSSTKWLYRHVNDKYVQLAKQSGYRSRAAFKLLEVDRKFNIFANVKCILDLGAAPGSWLQVVKANAYPDAILIGVDLLPIQSITGVHLIQGDFTTQAVQDLILSYMSQYGVDLIISDMAANASGDRQLDHMRSIVLVESVLEFATRNLRINGSLVIKLICGGTEHNIIKAMRHLFKVVKLFKPDASYNDSSEIYIVACNRVDAA